MGSYDSAPQFKVFMCVRRQPCALTARFCRTDESDFGRHVICAQVIRLEVGTVTLWCGC